MKLDLVSNEIIQSIIYFKNKLVTKENIKAFSFVFSIYIVAYISIFRSGVDYLDDLERGYTGKRGWQNFSRYTSNILSSLFNMSDKLTDMSPLTQLIAIIFLSLAACILARIFIRKHSYWGLACATLIGINPFFLESISFKFDAPYMALAVLMAIFPFAFIENRVKFVLISIPSLLVLYTTYQPQNSIFIILSIFYLLKMFCDDSKISEVLKTILAIGFAFLLPTAVFKFLIVTEINTYVSSSALSINNLLPGVAKNLINYFLIIYIHFLDTALAKIVVLLMILFPILMYLKIKNLVKVLLCFFSVVIASLSSYGLYTLLEKPLFEARALNGAGALIAVLLCFLLSYKGKLSNYVVKIFGFLIIWNCLVIANTYGNALLVQKEYNDYRLSAMITTLNSELSSFDNIQLFVANSDKKTAKEVEHASKVFPIINDLIRDRMQKQYWWSAVHNIKLKINVKPVVKKCVLENIQPIKLLDTALHKIEIYDKCVVVFFK